MSLRQRLPTCQVAKKRVDGMESFHFHQLRHTFTSKLLSYGAPPKDVGASWPFDVTTTMNIYAHASKEAKRDAAKLLDTGVIRLSLVLPGKGKTRGN